MTTAMTLMMQPALEAAAATRPSPSKQAEQRRPKLAKEKPLPAGAFRGVRQLPSGNKGTPADAARPQVSWPKGGEATVDLIAADVDAADPADAAARPASRAAVQPAGLTRAGDLPIWIGPAEASAARSATQRLTAATRVKVQLKDRQQALAAGVDGLLVTLEDAAAVTEPVAGAASVAFHLDYSAIADAHGGDWASRLHLRLLPSCALITPDKPECQQSTPLATRNDAANQRLVAQLTLPANQADQTGREGATPTGTAAPSATMVLAAEASASGPGGDWTASSLSPSAAWAAGGNTGGFTWSYPMQVPPVPGGLVPALGLSYASASTDGKTAADNAQASWVGEGFDLSTGYIERRYTSCADDQIGDADLKANQCWGTDNATMLLNGQATQLVWDSASSTWRGKKDDGSKIERLSGAVNGDNNGEYWKVTSQDGTQYFFGRNRPADWSAGQDETDSVLTVPVYGDDANEPCHNADGITSSRCAQGWRWNLDHIIDSDGNTVTYFYGRETNHYTPTFYNGWGSGEATPYHSGGYLKRIDYGQRTNHVYDTPASARVVFTVADRTDYPDDRLCAANTDCGDENVSPTFFDRKRLTTITTQLRNGSGYDAVDSWSFEQSYLQGLWLESITQTGHVGGTLAMPPITFVGTLMDNRVVSASPDNGGTGVDHLPQYKRARVTAIDNGTGGVTSISYAAPECAFDANSMPAAKSNTRRCYPVYWTPPGYADPVQDWFHKHVVASVVESDQRGGAVQKITSYAYKGGAAWRYAEDDGLTKDKYRTWSDWRGFATVETTVGDPAAGQPLTRSSVTYLRGMDGNYQGAGQPKQSVSVNDSRSELTVKDADHLAGGVLETRLFNGAFTDTAEVSSTIAQPWSRKTATRTASWGEVEAYMVDTAWEKVRTKKADGTARAVETRYSYDSLGRVVAVDDEGDIATTADDACRHTFYPPLGTTHVPAYAMRQLTVARDCDDAASTEPNLVAGQVITDVKSRYDGQAYGLAPIRGNVTAIESLSGVSAGKTATVTTTTTSYDSYGRPIAVTHVGDPATSADDRTTTTAYQHNTNGQLTSTTITTPKVNVAGTLTGLATTTTFDPARGSPLKVVDANNNVAEAEFDPLGRMTASWLPGRDKATYPTTPSARNTYTVPAANSSTPVSIKTETIRTASGSGPDATATYATSIQLLDGLMRTRQSQAEADSGRRLVTESFYDSRGLAFKANAAYLATGAPAGTLAAIADNAAPAQTVTLFDGVERPIASILYTAGAEKWRTTTAYAGSEITTVTPPTGAFPTATVIDARGRTVEMRQYLSTTLPATYDSTKYSYDAADRQNIVTGPDGATWTDEFDERGRISRRHDPDKGTVSFTYTPFDEVATTTDARGITLTTSYDALGRKLDLKQGTTLLAAWTYDTKAKGQPSSSTRYLGGNAYVSEVTGYDERYRPYGTKITIPAVEGKLAGSYVTSQSYNLNGSLDTTAYPAAGDLPAEYVTTYYDALGRPEWNTGISTYIADTTYTGHNEIAQLTYGARTGKFVWQTFEYEPGTHRLKRAMVDRETVANNDADVTYTHNNAGALTAITDAAPGKPADRQCFTYDYLQRLTAAWTVTGATSCATAPVKANIGGPAPYWHTYAYNKGGSRTTETLKAIGSATTDTVRTYTPSAPLGSSGKTSPHALAKVAQTGPGARTDTFTYDNAGNTTKRVLGTTTQTLDWDAEGHLAKVAEGTKVTEYLYDADGNRLLRRDPTATTLYLPGQELALNKTSQVLTCTRYYTHAGQTVAVRTATGLDFVLADHHGTGQLQIDATDQSLAQTRSLPFGGVRGTNVGIWTGEKGFVGGTRDTSTGLTHLGAREYDPATGRFISVDPILDLSNPQQLHGYTYAGNNPINYADPSGLNYYTNNACADDCYGKYDEYISPSKKNKKGKYKQTKGATHNSDGTGTTSSGKHYGKKRNGKPYRGEEYEPGSKFAKRGHVWESGSGDAPKKDKKKDDPTPPALVVAPKTPVKPVGPLGTGATNVTSGLNVWSILRIGSPLLMLLSLCGDTPGAAGCQDSSATTTDEDSPYQLYRAPAKGNRWSEAAGLNPANHPDTGVPGYEGTAYLGDSEEVAQKYAAIGTHEDGYHEYTMKPGFLRAFPPGRYMRTHDNRPDQYQWLIPRNEIPRFNSYIGGVRWINYYQDDLGNGYKW
ncbi:RHS repeat-associated core domain-containing protein [Nonomuraea soli]|uniref:RHS repeat-associated protein n=1 Tax=Nonomuraea soli TaxID=1032476 RepID=A0A7W0CVB6_9ACTN|nr:RHS repeat-associated core domain-containing protein [Nonomuraea soli]MBA2897794.1 RHS repeat-associated protein [Nonomuraea soli]